MVIEPLLKQITQYGQFTTDELELISSKFIFNEYQPKEFILQEGQISTHIHFILQGLVRVFYLKDGKEVTNYLSCDDGFVSSYSSFINQTRSFEFIQCIEHTETFSIQYGDMQELYERVPQWQKIGRVLSESTVVCLAERLMKIHSIPAKQKYLDFLETSPKKIVQRTPLVHIASFLGITPESLSRIRKDIS